LGIERPYPVNNLLKPPLLRGVFIHKFVFHLIETKTNAMKIAATIVGCFCTFLILMGTLCRAFSWPGAGILTTVGTNLFMIAFQPLLLVWQLKKLPKTSVSTVAYIVGFLAGWSLFTGLLFISQHWPGAWINLYLGIGMSAAFLILYFIHLSKLEAGTKKTRFLTFLAPFVVLLLAANIKFSNDHTESMDSVIARCTDTYQEKLKTRERVLPQIAAFVNDPANREQTEALSFLRSTDELYRYIDDLAIEVCSETNGIDRENCRDMDPKAYPHPDNYDIPSHMLVGSDIENPTGKGTELYQKLKKYRKDVLPSDIELEIRLDEMSGNLPWVSDYFYQHPLAFDMTIFNRFETALLKAAEAYLQKKQKL
jgi:hypothetical protein